MPKDLQKDVSEKKATNSLRECNDAQLMHRLKKAHEELGDLYFELFRRQGVPNATSLIHLSVENLINSFIMTEFNNFLGYAKNSHSVGKTQNRRNGYYHRELNFIGLQDSFKVKLPRDRDGLFRSSLFDVHARYLPEHEDLLDNLTLSLRKRGISQQVISDAFNESLDGVTCSQASISRNLNPPFDIKRKS